MAVTSIMRDWGTNPAIVRMSTSDTLATVAGAGYLTAQADEISVLNSGEWEWLASDMVLVVASDGVGFFTLNATFTTLVAFVFIPGVTLPTVIGNVAVFDSVAGNLADSGAAPSDPAMTVFVMQDGAAVIGHIPAYSDVAGTIDDVGYLPSNAAKTTIAMLDAAVLVGHIAVYTDVAGTISDDAATAINAGNISAGLAGTAGILTSWPALAASGVLNLAAVVNATGDFDTTISNAAAVGQDQVVSIPDAGAATADFILSATVSGTQTIATNLSIIGGNNIQTSGGGNLLAGSSGNAGFLASFPAAALSGSLILQGVASAGNFDVTISNASHGQATVYSIPDIGAATGGIVVSTANTLMKSVQGAAAAGGAATQNFVDAFCTATSVVIGNWVTQTNPGQVLTIVPGVGSFDVVSNVDIGAGTFSYIILK